MIIFLLFTETESVLVDVFLYTNIISHNPSRHVFISIILWSCPMIILILVDM